MRFRTWPVAALGLGGLLLLVVVSVLAASSRAQEIYTQLDQLNTYQRDVETKLRTLRSDVQSSGIFIRDYLLDPEREHAPNLPRASGRIPSGQRGDGRRPASAREWSRTSMSGFRACEAKLDDYWQAFDPLFDWTLVGKNQPERQLPAPRGAAAPRGRPGDRLGNRGAEQCQPCRAARRGDATSRGSSAASCTGCCGEVCRSASSSR